MIATATLRSRILDVRATATSPTGRVNSEAHRHAAAASSFLRAGMTAAAEAELLAAERELRAGQGRA